MCFGILLTSWMFFCCYFNMVYCFVIPVVNLWTMYSTAQRFGGYDAVSITMLVVRFQYGEGTVVGESEVTSSRCGEKHITQLA